MSATRTCWMRLLVACVFGLGVAGVTILWVPGNMGAFILLYPQEKTRRTLEKTARLLKEFEAQHGRSPATLDELPVWRYDGWGKPLLYSRFQGMALIESLGRDGERGGVGLDADISNQNLNPPEARMPLLQRLEHPLAQPMIWVALLCGVMAGTMIFQVLASDTVRPESWSSFGFTLLIAFAMASTGAVFITAMHVPSGH